MCRESIAACLIWLHGVTRGCRRFALGVLLTILLSFAVRCLQEACRRFALGVLEKSKLNIFCFLETFFACPELFLIFEKKPSNLMVFGF